MNYTQLIATVTKNTPRKRLLMSLAIVTLLGWGISLTLRAHPASLQFVRRAVSASGAMAAMTTEAQKAQGAKDLAKSASPGVRATVQTNCPVRNTTSSTTFSTIQAAITAANAGDVIEVCAGTFSENNININKSLTLRGANHAAPAANGTGVLLTRAAETVLSSTGRLFTLSAADVTITGFKITNLGGRSFDSIAGPLDNLRLSNNWFICPTNQTPG